MAIFASTTLGSSDPARAMSIKALEARAQALAAASAQAPTPQSVPSPWQGVGNLANTAADALLARHADQVAGQRRADLAGYIQRAGDNPTMADVGSITGADTDVGKAYLSMIQQRREQAQQIQAAKEAAALQNQQQLEVQRRQQEFQAGQPKSKLGEITADLGRQPTPEEGAAAIAKETAPPPAQTELLQQTQQEHADLQTKSQELAEAAALLAKGTVEGGKGGVYSGPGGGARSEYGQTATTLHLGGVSGTTPEQNADTKRFNQILSTQVLDRLSKLKGSASDKDRAWAAQTINEPSAPLANKQRAVQILRDNLDAHLKISGQTLERLGGAPVKVQQPGVTAPAGGGGLLDEAKQAIARGAPRDKVIERLKAKGIDASGL
jgi:hypothetical protein